MTAKHLAKNVQALLEHLPGHVAEEVDKIFVESHHTARAHLEKCEELRWALEDEGEVDEELADYETFGPYCGCEVCTVREVIAGAIDGLWEAFKIMRANLPAGVS